MQSASTTTTASLTAATARAVQGHDVLPDANGSGLLYRVGCVGRCGRGEVPIQSHLSRPLIAPDANQAGA